MRIALITSEYPGLPGSGGIGSYFRHLAVCLARAGHEVEVFTWGTPGELSDAPGIRFHQLGIRRLPDFIVHAADAFTARHREAPFDVLESADYRGEGLSAGRAVPEVARVLRVHSPSVILNRYLDIRPTRGERMRRAWRMVRIALGAWRRGLPIPPIQLDIRPPLWFEVTELEERAAASEADLVVVMNDEMRRLAREYWWIAEEAIRQVPNPIDGLSSTPAPLSDDRKERVIGFAGRLEPRKGILELAAALSEVLPQHTEWRALFAGRTIASCLSGRDVATIAGEQLRPLGDRVEFLGSLPPEKMEVFLQGLDIVVFPSLWDNFPYAILEAMAAGKAIVATRTGAVPEMLANGEAGLLVEPGDAGQLAQGLRQLMQDAGLRQKLGQAARKRALAAYGEREVTAAIEKTYREAMERRDRRIRK